VVQPAERRPAEASATSFAARLAEAKVSMSAPANPSPSAEPSGAVHTMPGASTLAPAAGTKAERLAAMRPTVLACTKCPHLARSRKQVVFGVGHPEAQLMFVGEAPGADEDMVGEPFVGRAGQLLTKIIETMGLRRSDVFIANILKCRPDMPAGESGNRKPTPEEMATCKPYVLEQINIIQPRVLVALGGTAVEGLLNIEKAGITRLRGHWRDFNGIPLMPTFHPSFLLRPSADQQANKRFVWEDMLAVMEKLEMPISERQRGFFLAKG
jgi:DNA polymerase